MKKCNKCGIKKPETNEFFYWDYVYLRLRTPCIECKNKQKKEYRDNNKDKIREQKKKYRDKYKDKINKKQNIQYRKNKDQINKERKEKRAKHPEEALKKERNIRFKRDYGITLEDYNKMYTDQEGKCPICGRHQEKLKKSLYVDHNHKTGEVRGLLCSNCNLVLGHAKDNPLILENAIKYLKDV